MAIIVIDIDDFTLVNDRHGHGAGDELLCEVTALWASAIRGTDAIARVGGDEFVVVMERAMGDQARAVLDRVRGLTAQSFSAGIAAWDGLTPFEAMVARADEALYADKRLRRGAP
ncbi:GGDEF domain-containing protein [Herbiconiux moechotypicola]|uniref:GGDEF domain-containing protein n=1 Tax=Herbiconiux moechotypicola TaxID=637393 RepID=A0ABN3DPW6_9MICO|nr:GGDEF domain-containing protein [Herbiconiux moechotypicola]MCS5730336.1 GGDEF domain-containing protein [Herbiconiux moechotypicola]